MELHAGIIYSRSRFPVFAASRMQMRLGVTEPPPEQVFMALDKASQKVYALKKANPRPRSP